MASNKSAKTDPNTYHSYINYTYSEKGHLGLQEYVVFEKSNFLRKIDFLWGGSPLSARVEELTMSSGHFHGSARTIQRRMKWRRYKMTIIISKYHFLID
jgi:hypothetical protein